MIKNNNKRENNLSYIEYNNRISENYSCIEYNDRTADNLSYLEYNDITEDSLSYIELLRRYLIENGRQILMKVRRDISWISYVIIYITLLQSFFS